MKEPSTLVILLNQLQKEIHTNARNKGFYDHDFNVGEKLALVHSEVSEALEVARKYDQLSPEFFEKFSDELADIVIRVLDLAEALDVDVAIAIEEKHTKNKQRIRKHGRLF